jgi:hypothetical protein
LALRQAPSTAAIAFTSALIANSLLIVLGQWEP